MTRPTAEALAIAYSDQYKGAKPADRSAVNSKFRLEFSDLRSQLTSEIASRQEDLVNLADDVAGKRRIRQQIDEHGVEVTDLADLLALVEKRGPGDERLRMQGEATKLVSERRQIDREAADLDREYTTAARALRKTLDKIRSSRVRSDAHNLKCEKLQELGCEAASAGIGVVSFVRGAGFLDEIVELPSLEHGPAHWGKTVTEDDRPPRPAVPDPIDEFWGSTSVQNPDGSRRVLSPAPGSPEDRRRLSSIDRQRSEREAALGAARDWDDRYATAGGK